MNFYCRTISYAKKEVLKVNDNAVFLSGKWETEGQNYVDGYTYIYGYNAGDNSAKVEQQVIAIQDKRSGTFFGAPGFTVDIVKPVYLRDKFMNKHESGITVMPGSDDAVTAINAGKGMMTVKITVDADKAAKFAPWYKEASTEVRAYGRFNSESDFEGNYLGEVEIKLIATKLGILFSSFVARYFATNRITVLPIPRSSTIREEERDEIVL